MKTISHKIPLSILFFLIILPSPAQPCLTFYTDLGSNNAYNDLLIKTAVLADYRIEKNRIETGIQTDLTEKARFSGFTLTAAQEYRIKNLKVELEGFIILTYPSEIINESDLGFKAIMNSSHFEISIGTDFRSVRLRKEYLDDHYLNGKSVRFHEIYNIIYSLSYSLKPQGNNWNICLTVANADHFTIYQETNPEIFLSGFKNLNSRVSVFAQAWYKSAGVTNLVPNNFGFIFRTGITWKIN